MTDRAKSKVRTWASADQTRFWGGSLTTRPGPLVCFFLSFTSFNEIPFHRKWFRCTYPEIGQQAFYYQEMSLHWLAYLSYFRSWAYFWEMCIRSIQWKWNLFSVKLVFVSETCVWPFFLMLWSCSVSLAWQFISEGDVFIDLEGIRGLIKLLESFLKTVINRGVLMNKH